MGLPFQTHRIYITLEDNTFYELHSDYSKTVVDWKEIEKEILNQYETTHILPPFFVMHKSQFGYVKACAMSKSNPNRMSEETAEIYYKMGFITKEEFENYLQDKKEKW